MPSGSTLVTRVLASDFSAIPCIVRLRVMAGSVRWKKRSRSRRPPRRRTQQSPLVLPVASSTSENPKCLRQAVVQSRIRRSVFEMRRAWPPQDPSPSKIPARNPFRHSSLGESGHAMSCTMRSTFARADVRIARAARVVAVA
jgi:hypothetical protein